MRATKRVIAGELVGAFGRHMPDAPHLRYHIRISGKFFAAPETHLLADKVAEAFTKVELVELRKMIPEEEEEQSF